MKPAAFEYFAPATVDETIELLSAHGEDAKILAGGQSLMPLMNLRLARPRVVIDINPVSALDYVRIGPRNELCIGALTRQRSLEQSALVKERNPLLAAAMPLIGHFQIRNRGTIGGSVVHADPAAELPAVTLALGAEFVAKSAAAERVIPAAGFFLEYMTTALRPTELLTEIRLLPLRAGCGWAIEEVARRRGDFAIVGVVALLQVGEAGLCEDARLALFGVSERPVRAERGEQVLLGNGPEPKAFAAAAQAVVDELDPVSDVHASGEYRREAAAFLMKKALHAALARARGERVDER
ncbi:MAG TPA: xanthine dehydrogenase family protein subunit M [Candidatus Eisenbacteria bacterium]|nr:xanthine dehydrogenase family protein subunit M [Candidatus Eisenbacteria bacterium]